MGLNEGFCSHSFLRLLAPPSPYRFLLWPLFCLRMAVSHTWQTTKKHTKITVNKSKTPAVYADDVLYKQLLIIADRNLFNDRCYYYSGWCTQRCNTHKTNCKLVFYKQTCLFAKSDPPFASNLQDFENLFNQPFSWETCSEFCAGLSHLWSPNIQNIIPYTILDTYCHTFVEVQWLNAIYNKFKDLAFR